MIFTAILMLINHATWGIPMSNWNFVWTVIVDILAWAMIAKQGV